MSDRDEAIRFLAEELRVRLHDRAPGCHETAAVVVDTLLDTPDLLATLVMIAAFRGIKSTGVLAWEAEVGAMSRE